jgi:GH25 family lysozyme M1 (1,4-beta-N-acetylmuramidase)
VTGLRGRAGWSAPTGKISIAGAALIMMAGLAIPAWTAITATAATTPVQGTDVSNLTTVTSWPDVKAAGMTFVGIEAAQGKTITNSQYDSQLTGATTAGLFVMPYVFGDPGKIDGTTQWSKGWAVIDGDPHDRYKRGGLMLPIVLDMESDPINFPDEPCYGLSQTAMRTWVKAFSTADVKQTGAAPIIYTNPSWWASCVGATTSFSADPLWIANYGVSKPAVPSGWNSYTFWQYSNSATVSGIDGPADLDELGPVVQVSKVGTQIGPVQMRTLTSLAGQADSFSWAGSPPGLAMSSTGQITGKPTTAGQYTVTVTPSAGAVPSTMALTWDVHGTITVHSPGNRSTIAGTPVGLRVTASDTDPAKYAPSFTASGLPRGLSISSAGVISGWPSKPGTYKVTVSASDKLFASGSTVFTWTVKAAADSGVTSAIRQWGGTGKCLDDAGSRTANGTAVDLQSCTGKANQKWTVVQDGTIRVQGKCLDVTGESKTNGAKLRLYTCNSGDGAQQWQAGADSELVNPQSGKCLYVPAAKAANGTRPELWTCASSTGAADEHWLRPAASVYSGDAGKCLAVSGSTVVLAGCANTGTQHWTESWDGTLRLGSRCLTETGATVRSGLSVGSCSGAAATKWQLRPAGPIATELASAASGLCVTAPSAASGVKLVLGVCATSQAATWHVE